MVVLITGYIGLSHSYIVGMLWSSSISRVCRGELEVCMNAVMCNVMCIFCFGTIGTGLRPGETAGANMFML